MLYMNFRPAQEHLILCPLLCTTVDGLTCFLKVGIVNGLYNAYGHYSLLVAKTFGKKSLFFFHQE